MVRSLKLVLCLVTLVLGGGAIAGVLEAQGNVRIYRPARPADPLDERWRSALADAERQRLADFWIAYGFETPVHAEGIVISDTNGTSISSNGRIKTPGPSLIDVLRDGGGNIVVLLRYRGTSDDSFDRVGYRSARIGFDFEGAPVFWLGFADESQSFARVRTLFERARTEKLQRRLIELASIHGNSNTVIPFLARLVELSRPAGIRSEATEGFGNQHDPRSVDVLLRVARTDPVSEVRVEAAETIGEVQVPQAVPALIDLVNRSDDHDVRMEAVEAFGDSDDPAAMAALIRITQEHADEEIVSEAIETIADLSRETLHPHILTLAASGRTARVRRDAVEAIGDAVSENSNAAQLDRAEQALVRAVFDDPDTSVNREALDSLEKLPRDRETRVLRQVIDRHPDSRVRREAEDHLREKRR